VYAFAEILDPLLVPVTLRGGDVDLILSAGDDVDVVVARFCSEHRVEGGIAGGDCGMLREHARSILWKVVEGERADALEISPSRYAAAIEAGAEAALAVAVARIVALERRLEGLVPGPLRERLLRTTSLWTRRFLREWQS
jgi:hypothetical protein